MKPIRETEQLRTYDLFRKRLHLRMAASTYLFTEVKVKSVALMIRDVVETTLNHSKSFLMSRGVD